jgi:hypothetical protein
MRNAVNTKLAVLVVMTGLVAACGQQKAKTKAYYLQHRDEMKAVLKDCSNRGIVPLGDTADARNCMAAINAENDIYFSRPGDAR